MWGTIGLFAVGITLLVTGVLACLAAKGTLPSLYNWARKLEHLRIEGAACFMAIGSLLIIASLALFFFARHKEKVQRAASKVAYIEQLTPLKLRGDLDERLMAFRKECFVKGLKVEEPHPKELALEKEGIEELLKEQALANEEAEVRSEVTSSLKAHFKELREQCKRIEKALDSLRKSLLIPNRSLVDLEAERAEFKRSGLPKELLAHPYTTLLLQLL